MYVHVQVIKPASSKLGSACCQEIIVIEGKGLPVISTATAVPVPQGSGLIDLHWQGARTHRQSAAKGVKLVVQPPNNPPDVIFDFFLDGPPQIP